MATLDVRSILAAGTDPFHDIMAAVDALSGAEPLEIIAPFEPVPLYAVMEGRGFTHKTEGLSDGSWKIVFTRE